MRNLITHFWELRLSERREIALGLKLITKQEIALPEKDRYDLAFIRASQMGLLEELGSLIIMKFRNAGMMK